MAVPFDKSGIIEFFLIEAGEHLQNLNQGLLSLEKDPRDSTIIDELFRAAHTLKGSAAMMGFSGISDVAHKAEDMLGQFRSGSLPIRKETLNFLFDSVDAIKLMVDGVAANKPEDPLVIDTIKQSYKDVTEKIKGGAPETRSAPSRPAPANPAAAEKPAAAKIERVAPKAPELKAAAPAAPEPKAPAPKPLEPPVPPPAAAPQPPASLQQEIEDAKRSGVHEKRGVGRRAADAADIEKQFIRVNIERLDNLMNLVGEMVVNRNRLARQVEFIKTLREELAFSQSRLLHEIKKFEEKYEYTLTYGMAGPEQAVQQSGDFMELEFDRYDDFNLLSRKLTEITNDTNEIMLELAGFFDSFEIDTARISTITTNLQDEITLARMVEMDKLYQMFQRPVRDLSLEENKQVKMVVSGGETKID